MNSQPARELGNHSEHTERHATRFDHLIHASIMMVDDESITMDVVQAFLEEAGYYKFDLIEDPLRALVEMEEQQPDILLLDLNMPGKNGFEILAEVRGHPELNHLPVVVLTSSTDTETKLRALDLGATDFLSKPVDPSELILRVRNTLAVKSYQDQLAYYDPLTGLPNRRRFMEQLGAGIKKALRTGEQFALLNIDIDQFDKISDMLGVGVSDELLIQVARRIESVVRDTDELSSAVYESKPQIEIFRFERGEFSLALYSMQGLESSATVAERIRLVLKRPFHVSRTEICCTASIGIAGYPNDSQEAANLLKQATSAKDYARRGGGDSFQFFSADIKARYAKRISMESKLRQAIVNDELELWYQPKVSIATNEMLGAEVLLRWNNSDLGLVPPCEFIKLAEETDLIVSIGQWMMEAACQTLRDWQLRFDNRMSLALNLSPPQLHNEDFLSMITGLIASSGIDASGLSLELTESQIIDNSERNLLLLAKLKETGVLLSVDDFGTGYSALSYLQQLPVDELKIDQSFIAQLEHSEPSRAITSSIIFLAHRLGLKIVAEGVETQKQLDFLKAYKCQAYQGYLFSRPVSKQNVEKLICASPAN